jgi:hypothetical protein
MTIVLYAIGNISLVFLAVAVPSGFAYDIQKRIDSEKEPART